MLKGTLLRISIANSLFLLANRFLYRFFSRLRANLRTEDARPFRKRNPRIAKALTSKYTPGIGASLACFLLGLYPQTQTRISLAIYSVTGSLEFVYNALREKGWFENKPWETIRGMADRAFMSPILHPTNPNILPTSLQGISPITSPAHPAVASLSCALLHPQTPSCLTAFLQQNLLSIPPLARTVSKVMLALSLLRFKSLLVHPINTTNILCRKILSITAVLSAAIGSAWGSICLFNSILPGSLLRTQRFYLSGALAGAPFMFFGAAGYRSHFIYFFRLALHSAWKVGVKRGLWRGWKGGELWLLAVSWAVTGAVLESRPSAVTGPGMRKMLAWVRGDGYVDQAELRAKKKGKRAVAE
ncbi:hypothetical protein PRK78_004546 [Emydomyces testavorans]|uniref:Uncharacterized protein n=1 Tax=Emydomyces testavorans TaxID=2070801 RepID=A0AAF0DK36_9EURO|nr:hypothetical protein PRK78_004546 [Emydomyces testavorans]